MNTVIQKAEQWTKPPFDENTQNEIKQLIQAKNEKELQERFALNLEFGTGGMRGEMAAGTNRMNTYTVAMATQGLADYLLKWTPEPSVAIAHDSRNNSELFALITAEVLTANGIKCYYFNELKPTPLLSFAIRYLKTTAGVNITASHNPKEYNGYKVFFSDGCQVLPPHETGIISQISAIQSPEQVKRLSLEQAAKKGLYVITPDEVIEQFYQTIEKIAIRKDLISEKAAMVSIVYTPLHGAGITSVPEILKRLKFSNVHIVEKQRKPDGNFPTVKVPNPEEKEALSLAVELGIEKNADIVIATDPDCDRMGIAVKHHSDFQLLNGNETGIIMAYYMLSSLKELGKLPDNAFIVKTIVTTESINAIAEDFGVQVIDSLTGFKYIGHVIEQNCDKKRFIMGFEESYGYLTGDFIRDKCGVSATSMIAEIALYCKTRGMTLIDYLHSIFQKYGFRQEFLKSFTLKGMEGSEKIKAVMANLRKNPPQKIGGHAVEMIRDAEQSVFISNGKICGKLDLPKSNVLTFYLDDKTTVTARPSGTEPKIKFYFSVSEKVSDNKTMDEVKAIADEKGSRLIDAVTEWLN